MIAPKNVMVQIVSKKVFRNSDCSLKYFGVLITLKEKNREALLTMLLFFLEYWFTRWHKLKFEALNCHALLTNLFFFFCSHVVVHQFWRLITESDTNANALLSEFFTSPHLRKKGKKKRKSYNFSHYLLSQMPCPYWVNQCSYPSDFSI